MTFNTIPSIYEFMNNSDIKMSIFSFVYVQSRTTKEWERLGSLAIRVSELSVLLRDKPLSSVEEKRQCNEIKDRLHDFYCLSVNDLIENSCFITKIFIFFTGFFTSASPDSLDFIGEIHYFKDLNQ